MKYFHTPSRTQWGEICLRPSSDNEALLKQAERVFHEVAERGELALREYTHRFDGIELEDLWYTARPMEELEEEIDVNLQRAIRQAYSNIALFHQAQRQGRISVETMPGVECWQEHRPIPGVGLYIPGGTAPLFSTVLMLVIPARIAGCRQIVLCTPPNKEERVHPVMQYAARLCGLDRWLTLGGMQAMAALSLGTESIPRVDKLFGPGNQYVTAGKQYAHLKGTAIDMPAGPSELLVFTDATANPAYVAADLLSQAEHGADSQVVLISLSQEILEDTLRSLDTQIGELPRKELAEKAIENSVAIVFEEEGEALAFINTYGPEHLIISTAKDQYYAEKILHAGSVFLGPYSPESAGDYASGTNHTLPTAGFARAYSGVNLGSFTKAVTFQRLTAEGLLKLGPHIEYMAEAEELRAHKNAVSIRLADLNRGQYHGGK